MAQYAGRHFVSGANSMEFATNDRKWLEGTQSSGTLSADLSVGKFVTDQKATGWTLRGGLMLRKTTKEEKDQYLWSGEDNGITGFHAGLGKFWQHYKHVNEHWGFYGGPAVQATVDVRNEYSLTSETHYLHRRTSAIRLGLTLSAGAYYKLSEKCWLNASLAFINPLAIALEKQQDNTYEGSSRQLLGESTTRNFYYQLKPDLYMPSVGLGFTYFVR
jgi:hypothetical protein